MLRPRRRDIAPWRPGPEARVADLSTLIYGAAQGRPAGTIWLYPDADRSVPSARHVRVARP